VIVAMIAVGMVKMAIDQVVHMVTVRHGRVSAAFGVLVMTGWVTLACVAWCAGGRVGGIDWEHVLIDMVAVHMMHVPVVEVVGVIVVLDGSVPAALAVDVSVEFVDVVAGQRESSVK